MPNIVVVITFIFAKFCSGKYDETLKMGKFIPIIIGYLHVFMFVACHFNMNQ